MKQDRDSKGRFIKGNAINVKYTNEQREWLKNNFPKYYDKEELAKEFNKTFKENKPAKTIYAYCIGVLKTKRPRNFERQYMPMIKASAGKNLQKYPIGSERENGNNIEIKIAHNKWVYKAKYIYEQHYGPLPKGYDVVFLDGNNRNFAINNLGKIKAAHKMHFMRDGQSHDVEYNKQLLEYLEINDEIKKIIKEVHNAT